MTASGASVRRGRRRFFTALLICMFGTLVAAHGGSTTAGSWAGPRQSAGDSTDLPDGVSRLIDCIARNQYLAAVVLVDESGSLKRTDPEARRVDFSLSLAAALRQISAVRIDDLETTLDVLVVGFSTDVRNADLDAPDSEDWVTVADPDAYGRVEAAIGTFRDRNLGLDTDYVTALQTAQDLLLRRTQAVGDSTTTCSAILWFTDGKFDISPSPTRRPWAQDVELDERGSDDVVIRGVDLLCDAGGIADRLRSSDTFLLTFALLSPSFEGDDELLLRRITLGEADCGEIDAAPLGAYFPGTAPDDLVDCFYLALQGRGCTPTALQVDPPCTLESGCPVDFVVDDSTVSVRIEIFAEPTTSTVTLRPPGGAPIPIRDLVADSVSGAALTTTSSNRAGFITLTIDSGMPGVLGTWQVDHRPVEGGTLEVAISVTPNYRLTLDVPSSVVRGEPFDAEVAIVGSSGQPIDPSTLADSERILVETIDGDDVTEHVAERVGGQAVFRASIVAPTNGSAPTIEARAEATFRGVDGSVRELGTSAATIEAILPGFPAVESNLAIGALEAQREADRRADGTQPVLPIDAPAGSLTVRAPRDVGGSVCVVDTRFEVGGTSQTLVPDSDCIELAAGGRGDIGFSFIDTQPVAGVISGFITLALTSDLDGSTRTIEVPIEGSIVVPPPDPYSDAGRRLWLLVLGIVLPLAVYVLGALRASKFEDPSLISIRTLEAQLDPDGLRLIPGDDGVLGGFGFLLADRSGRRAHGGSLSFRAPRRVIRLPGAFVSSARSSAAIITDFDPRVVYRDRAPIGHQLQGQWIFVGHSVDGGRVTGTFSVLVQEPDGTGAIIKRLEANASNELPACRSDLVDILNNRSEIVSGTDSPDAEATPPGSSGGSAW